MLLVAHPKRGWSRQDGPSSRTSCARPPGANRN